METGSTLALWEAPQPQDCGLRASCGLALGGWVCTRNGLFLEARTEQGRGVGQGKAMGESSMPDFHWRDSGMFHMQSLTRVKCWFVAITALGRPCSSGNVLHWATQPSIGGGQGLGCRITSRSTWGSHYVFCGGRSRREPRTHKRPVLRHRPFHLQLCDS